MVVRRGSTVVVIFLKTVFFSKEGGTSWETFVLLKCDLKEERGDFQVWKDKYPQEIVSD